MAGQDEEGAAAAGEGGQPPGLLSASFALTVLGIYACFLSCSVLHEAIYRVRDSEGEALSPWFVNMVEAGANVLVAAAGMGLWEGVQPWVPQRGLATTGCLQVLSKYCASASRLQGVPGPVGSLVKSARPLPVMVGQRLIAGTLYTAREYLQYLLIVASSALVGAARSPLASDGFSPLGLLCLAASVFCDGYVGGRQKAMKGDVRAHRRAQGLQKEDLQPFEMQFYTNGYMLATSAALAAWTGDLRSGAAFLAERPDTLWSVALYAAGSAFGQVFVFVCVTSYDPLILSMVTSSRKMLSVVLTLVAFGYEIDATCCAGLLLATVGLALVFGEELERQRAKASRQQQ